MWVMHFVEALLVRTWNIREVALGFQIAMLIPGAGERKRIHFVVSNSWRDISVTGAPVDGAVHYGGPVDN